MTANLLTNWGTTGLLRDGPASNHILLNYLTWQQMILLQLIKQSRLHCSPLRFTKTNATLKAEVTNISFDLQKSVRRSRWIESLNVASPLNLKLSHRDVKGHFALQRVSKCPKNLSGSCHSTIFSVIRSALNSTESVINNMGKQKQWTEHDESLYFLFMYVLTPLTFSSDLKRSGRVCRCCINAPYIYTVSECNFFLDFTGTLIIY